jgi:hypothetical protein
MTNKQPLRVGVAGPSVPEKLRWSTLCAKSYAIATRWPS